MNKFITVFLLLLGAWAGGFSFEAVAGLGLHGSAQQSFFSYIAAAITSNSAPPVQQGLIQSTRTANYTGGTPGNDYNAIFGRSIVSAGVANYEWAVLGQVDNSATGGQNVGVQGTTFKENTGGQVGPSWGGNFVCHDLGSTADPIASCIGAEVDAFISSATSDSNKQRVGLQVVAGSVSGAHIGYGILMNSNSGAIFDTGVFMQNAYGNGIDMTTGTFTGSPLLAPLITPASSSASCTKGSIEWDASFIYICTATNTWQRATLASF